ncbi:2,3-butanediol dehydrogenase [Rhodococcus sp. BP-252]|uniref:2,3-butanediol dehydrogenase n=1 Tax=unclassified Rhodococcus (in: high G+C Gram-positive bacteria) TaxID=192944 RepID=UPI001C9B29E5|nr:MULTISPECIES: 2,3-butanediol dehydrogenase [unclassified Rhodococcus (in: high G+C Gram-positive bacteria)]MBY6412827.1 2,3-butanediol dehydrogenase [Rhodococcus sp. BP-320]MBY6417636.1 2,3-butanediol dehydrogenase [Rhodococcus sp. BP-321]MBY6423488.1 2,3-butanediol dehydrogenase [Rhodococcus sp. BP-324]MBY6427660.1 2,3-butanediol dehydrogenase [Rhodococcus sp. BP-323]MBY6432824.1 2,3-butanediol dehydrogenase [Rhodococcus sp. BP-322]
MRGAVYYAPGDIRIESIADVEPSHGQVKLRVAHNGVCGSDLHEYFSGQTFIPSEPHPLTGQMAPIVLGHEFSGTVVAVGDGVDINIGARVAVRPTLTCGQCPACTAGVSNVCRKLAFHGLSAATGGLSEYSVVDANAIHVLPETVSLEMGALVEPMAVSYHAVTRSGVKPGDVAVISGLGPIGIGLWFALRDRGIHDVIVSDPSDVRRRALKKLGAEHVVNPRHDNIGDIARDLSSGTGASAVFDAAGVGAAITSGVAALRPHGKVVVVGIHEQPMSLNPTSLLLSETEIIGSIVYSDDDYSKVIAAMAAGSYTADGWVEHAPLDSLVDIYHELRQGNKLKVLIDV